MNLRDYLKQMMKLFEPYKDKQPNYDFYKWMLKRGKVRKKKPFTKKELKIIQKLMRESGIYPQAKQCYYVAQMLALSGFENVKYIEGIAVHLIPTEHAWLEFNGKVLDPTWGCIDHVNSPDKLSAAPECDYFGVEIPIKMVAEHIAETRMAEPIISILFRQELKK